MAVRASWMTGRALVVALSLVPVSAGIVSAIARNTLAAEQASAMKLELKIGEKEVAARLINNETTRDFVSLLPLTITINDLFNRESGDLPRRISEGRQRAWTYEVGDHHLLVSQCSPRDLLRARRRNDPLARHHCHREKSSPDWKR
jgi:hypothetical protein